jgi:hypothetical protein
MKELLMTKIGLGNIKFTNEKYYQITYYHKKEL